MFSNFRHKLQFAIILLLVFIAFCTKDFWIQWTFLASIAVFLLILGNNSSIIIRYPFPE